MNFQELKEHFVPWFEDMGFVARKPSKNLFIQDRGFYLIIAELQPLYDYGFFLNLAVKFLWTDKDILSFDYSEGDSRIYGTPIPHPTGATFFISPTLYAEIEYMKKQARKLIKKYQKLSKLKILSKKLSSRKDSVVVLNRGYEKRDTDLAIAKALLGKSSEAGELFSNSLADYHDPLIKELSDLRFDKDAFTAKIIEITNGLRKTLSKKLRIPLEDISSL